MQRRVEGLVKAVATIREELDGELSATKAEEAKTAYRIQLCVDGLLVGEECQGLGVYMPEPQGPTNKYYGGHVGEDGKWRPERQEAASSQ